MFRLPAFRFRVALIKPQDLGREKRGFVATRARANLNQCIAILIRIGGKQRVLDVLAEFLQRLLQPRNLLRSHLREIFVFRARQLLVLRQLALGLC